MEVNNTDLWIMLLSTIRYALGRQSYIVEDSCQLVVNYQKALSKHQLNQIAGEIREEVERYRRLNQVLPCEKVWIDGEKKITEIAEKSIT